MSVASCIDTIERERNRRSIQTEDGCCSLKTASGSQCDCLACSRSHDGQLLLAAGTGQCDSPSQADVQASSFAFAHSDAQGSTRPHSRRHQRVCRLSIQDAGRQSEAQSAAFSSRVFDSAFQSLPYAHRRCRQPFVAASARPQSCVEGDSRQYPRVLPLVAPNSDGGVVYITNYEEMSPDVLYDFQIPDWHSYIAGGIVNHNCGKTYSAAAEVACHLTGIYPEWWKGHRFSKPINAWVCGTTNQD